GGRIMPPETRRIRTRTRPSLLGSPSSLAGSKAENGPTASLTLCRLNQFSLLPTQGTHMRGSTLTRALFATVLLPMFAQPQLSRANPLSPPSGSYELTARLELPHLDCGQNNNHLSVQHSGS